MLAKGENELIFSVHYVYYMLKRDYETGDVVETPLSSEIPT